MKKITVIDAPCGQGKTTWAIQEMNANKARNYIFCTPFLDEISRVQRGTAYSKDNNRFWQPTTQNKDGTKITGFNNLLAYDKCIAVTHTTFLNANEETLSLIRNGGYSLIIDEALEVVTEFNKVQSVENAPKQSVTDGDLKMLLERKIINIEQNGRVVWCGGEYGNDYKFSELERFAKLGRLYCAHSKLLLVIFPAELFEAFEKIYVLTYMFNGSIMKSYFDLFGIDYELNSVCNKSGRYELIEYDSNIDIAFRSHCKELIHICDNKRMNDYGKNALSKTWYVGSTKDGERLKKLKNNISNYFCRYLKHPKPKASNGDIMWTCMGEYETKLKGKGYTHKRQLTTEEKELPEEELKKLKADLNCFVPCNARASNNYKDRWALAYCVNMYFNPMLRAFFEGYSKGNESGGSAHPNDDLFAVSCMIQWIFRSRIRDNLPIEIYIPNKRMRELLTAWLDNKI